MQRFAGAVPVEKSQIEPGTDHMRTQLRFDLFGEQLSGLAIDHMVQCVDLASVEDGQLKEIRIRYDAGQRPASRYRHLDLALQQRLADLQVRKELSAFEQLRLDPAVLGLLDSAKGD